ncbi:MAG: indolepyruvate ferredoxin oxidoreductase subunit alpha [Lachnospiraceae bacterium]|nr:indolepyruvate ferredoxin oxidoreductase subunit alpha [Lachnospiraceae bacterium]MBR6850035.1 indolepyruvate ferredoxin oxidoreductase subunit alpha [Lachnospiraceae bacterium]
MGNGAIALGALKAGVNIACGYPGTPSSEIIETLAKRPHEGLHLEWSVNEKAALEVAAAAAYSGARALVTMKQVGLNVASDPLMSLAYVGVEGGMVIVSADDPGPISSQTEQDTRRFADFARIPVFDPASPEEAFEMIQDAFAYSEKYKTPVIFRPTTRVDHGYASVEASDTYVPKAYDGFQKDAGRFVIFPRLSYKNHGRMEERNVRIGEDFSSYKFNTVEGAASEKAVLASGISYMYAKEFLKDHPEVKLIRVATAYPLPESFLLKALDGVREVLCIEELSPYLEEQLLKLAGKHHLSVTVLGKLTSHVPAMGENSADGVAAILRDYLNISADPAVNDTTDLPELPVRPPVLCAGCPHRASFYAVKKAMAGEKTYYCGDIGCYTLGNSMPLDMVDTCLCMGAGVTMAQGFSHIDGDGKAFAFIGDSTFFASGITGVVNAVFNEADITICILDNSTTAMTGHQPHPGTGINLMGHDAGKISITKILEGIGLQKVVTVDPLDLDKAIATVKECAAIKGVKAIIFKSPCIAIEKSKKKCTVTESCINCKKCIRETGCPALTLADGKVVIDALLCTGCGLCRQVCPVNAIGGDEE